MTTFGLVFHKVQLVHQYENTILKKKKKMKIEGAWSSKNFIILL